MVETAIPAASQPTRLRRVAISQMVFFMAGFCVASLIRMPTFNTLSHFSVETQSFSLPVLDRMTKEVPPLNATDSKQVREIKDFERQPGVVIATKIHGSVYMGQLKQCFCLLKAAYNDRMNYDIVVFSTLPLTDSEEQELQDIVHPANLRVVVDKQTLHQQVDALTPFRRKLLLDRCEVNSTDQLTWHTRCCEPPFGGSCMPLAYSWMSEFRSKQIWTQEVLAKYRYMLWYDSDAMATQVWKQDPVATMIRNNLAILFAHWPQGSSAGEELKVRMKQAYNETLCGLQLEDGHFVSSIAPDCGNDTVRVRHIHGFFHITDLDFYRSPENLRWSEIQIGDSKFSRHWDDQLAVTVPAAMRAPERSWEMEANGINIEVWHNGYIMGKRKWRGGGYRAWWQKESATKFPEARDVCRGLITDPGR